MFNQIRTHQMYIEATKINIRLNFLIKKINFSTIFCYILGLGGLWDTISPSVLFIGSEAVSSIALAAVGGSVFATSGRRIAVIDPATMDLERNINIGTTSTNSGNSIITFKFSFNVFFCNSYEK